MSVRAAAVLAGGRSRRLGVDKRLVEIGGRTLLARTVATVAPLVSHVDVIIAREDDRATVSGALGSSIVTPHATTVATADVVALSARSVRIVVDGRPEAGPGAGLETALRLGEGDVLVLAADHPWLSTEVVELLLAEAARYPDRRAIALEGPFGAEPLLAVYRTTALPTVTALLDAGVRRLQALLAALDPLVVNERRWRAVDPDGRALADVDTAEDLARLLGLGSRDSDPAVVRPDDTAPRATRGPHGTDDPLDTHET
jgi:molybdenum cofactor guanylyltransferase